MVLKKHTLSSMGCKNTLFNGLQGDLTCRCCKCINGPSWGGRWEEGGEGRQGAPPLEAEDILRIERHKTVFPGS